MVAGSKAKKVFDDSKAHRATFFGVELGSGDVVTDDGGRNNMAAVISIGQSVSVAGWISRKRMDEVDGCSRLNAVEKRALPTVAIDIRRESQRGPTNMGDFLRISLAINSGNRFHWAGNQSQPWPQSEFLANVEKKLHAQADAEQRPASLRYIMQGFEQTAGFELRDPGAERPNPRQHDTLRRRDNGWVSGKLWFCPTFFK
jgi:hypothetical protein